MKIAIDVKNLALFTGGISAYIKPLIKAWIEYEPQVAFVLIGPKIDLSWLQGLKNFEYAELVWPNSLPRQLRHPVYDLIIFPRAVKRIKPDFLFTPYHDVLLPKHVPSIMMIHDTCIGELKDVYPRSIRVYYEKMLRINLKRSINVFTVSYASKSAIMKRYLLEEEMVQVIPNAFEKSPYETHILPDKKVDQSIVLFYPGGADFRKNVKRLVLALSIVQDCGYSVILRVTGNLDGAWERELKGVDQTLMDKVKFLGYLDQNLLNNEYIKADVVVYPTLCEGFGRVCLEAMGIGAKLACSDIPVLHEVADDYAVYFNPFNIEDIAKKIIIAYHLDDKSPLVKKEYLEKNVSKLFVDTIKKYIS